MLGENPVHTVPVFVLGWFRSVSRELNYESTKTSHLGNISTSKWPVVRAYEKITISTKILRLVSLLQTVYRVAR